MKAGKATLTAAEKNEAKAKAKAAALEAAYQRIATVCGNGYALEAKRGAYLRKRSEVLAFADLNDADMLKTKGLIASGFTLARAKKYRMTALSRTHSIGDLCLRAQAVGGTYSLDGVAVGDGVYDITVKRREPAPATLSPQNRNPT